MKVTETIRSFVSGVNVWQSETAHTYQCPYCLHALKTQYEGDVPVTRVECRGPFADHVIEWDSDADPLLVP